MRVSLLVARYWHNILRCGHSTLGTLASVIFAFSQAWLREVRCWCWVAVRVMFQKARRYFGEVGKAMPRPAFPLYSTLYTDLRLCTPDSTLYTPLSTLHTVYCTLYTLHSKLTTPHSTSRLYTLPTPHFTPYSRLYTPTLHCTSTPHIPHSFVTLDTQHSTLLTS